jgi:hypothetical protein
MTRKDYEAIARSLRNDAAHLVDEPFDYDTASAWRRGAFDQWSTSVLALSRTLRDLSDLDRNGNRRFDQERFLSACGFRGGAR